jgi:ribosome-associated toxin RatA of RatAB toxin-antitoxin module
MPDQSTPAGWSSRSSQSLTIAAQPAEVLSVIGDFPAYPQWADSIRTCEVLTRHADGTADQVRFVIDAGMIQDDFVLAYRWGADRLRVDWDLVRGELQRMQTGSYQLELVGRQTQVTYTLAVDLTVPLLAIFKRRAEKAIMDTALQSLKKRVEGGR